MNRWSVLIGSLAFIVASCGGDSSSGDTSEPAAESSAPASDPPPDSIPSDSTSPTTAVPPTDASPVEPTTDGTDGDVDGVEEDESERPDPCSVWTVADLEAATGLAFTEGEYNETLSVNGQDICDWITTGDAFGNAQVLVLAPGLDHDFLRSGTDSAAGPVTDLEITGAEAAHISADGYILGIDVGTGVVLQLAYIPPGAVTNTGDQLIQLANAAVANLAGE